MKVNKKYISAGLIVVICLMLFASIFSKESTEVSADTKEEVVVEESTLIYVEIKGAVNNPGVYSFTSESRVFDAIEVAGGLVEDANIEYINQTVILEDQMLIVIMTNEQIAEAIANQELIERNESEVNVAQSQSEIIGYDSCYSGDSSASGLISINTATREQLMSLDGIGEAKANDIISYRETNGQFKNIEELMNVSGIGEATFNKIKDYITV